MLERLILCVHFGSTDRLSRLSERHSALSPYFRKGLR